MEAIRAVINGPVFTFLLLTSLFTLRMVGHAIKPIMSNEQQQVEQRQ